MSNQTTSPIVAKKSYREGHVTVSMKLRCRGYGYDSANIDASTTLSPDQARSLARSLVELADAAEAKMSAKAAAKAAAEARRRKWMDQEINAGRMKVLGTPLS